MMPSLLIRSAARRCMMSTAAQPAASDPIAFLGLGAMGYPMAANLGNKVQGDVLVWNRTQSVGKDHANKHGSKLLTDDFEELSTARAVFLCLPTSDEVDVVMRRAQPHLRPGTVVVDITSGHPQQTQEIAGWLKAESGVDFMDCAVSGGPAGARGGTLASFVGCDDDAVVKGMVPDLESFSGHIVHLGPVGAGHAVKAINNAMNVSNLLCATEGLLALKSLGIDPTRALAVINKSSGRSLMSEQRLPQDVVSGWFNYGFKLGLMEKDVRIANDLLDEHFSDATIIRNTGRLLKESLELDELGFDSDYTEVVKLLEAQSNNDLRTESAWEWKAR